MQSAAKTPDQYFDELPDERKEPLNKLRQIVRDNIPEGFEEVMGYGMPGYVVPHSIYPDGYHVAPDTPLPFISLASQKRHIALYHMGLYSDKELLDWFTSEYPKHSERKLNMGKSCIRWAKPEHIPYDLIAELVTRMSVDRWVAIYESAIKK